MPSGKISFQKALSLQFAAVAVIPVLVVVLLIYAYVTPLVDQEITAKNQRLAEAVRAQTELFLNSPAVQLESLRSIISNKSISLEGNYNELLNISVSASNLFEAIYLVDEQGQVVDVGLPAIRQSLRPNYIGLDVSGRLFIEEARRSRQLTWSDTFLSAVSAKISLGLAIPVNEWVLVGDFSIERLSEFVQQLSSGGSLLPIIIDRSGHVIAHPSRALAAQQLNIGNLPLVKLALSGENSTGQLVFDQREYYASTTQISRHGWVALVGEPQEDSYHQIHFVLIVVSLSIAGAVLLAVLAARNRARKFSDPIRAFIDQAKALADGDANVHFPESKIREIDTMGDMFTAMAKAVREREERLSTIVREYQQFMASTQDLITRVDADGKFLFVNAAAGRVFGFSPEDCVGRSAFDFVHPDDQKYTIETFATWVQGGSDNVTFENRQCGQDGQVHYMLWNISANRDADGHVISFDSIARDFTERKLASEERETLIQELEIKNSELERFVYTISHELKSPLVTISGFSGALNKDIDEGNKDRIKKDIRLIISAVDTMSILLDNLLELSRIGRVISEAESFSLSDLIQETIKINSLQIGSVDFETSIPPDLPDICGDRIRIGEVLQNLVENAIKFKGDQSVPRIEIGAYSLETEAVCYVRDEGIGIEPSYHDKIFNLFERLESQIQGTGIGLAIVRRIVEVHGGRIWVESGGTGSGSSFYFSIPWKHSSA